MNVLAIDQGTSSTKALVIDGDGVVLGEATAPVTPCALGGGRVEQDPSELLESVLAAGREALAAAGAPVQAIGLTNQGETVLRWDRASGRPLGPALSWQDRRAADVCRELAPVAERLTDITGLPVDPYFAAPKMAWLRREHGAEGAVTMIDAWLTHQLTGELVTDAASASRTLLLDLERGEWSPEACEAFGLDPGDQPQIVDCAGELGETSVFGGSLPVHGLIVDQQAALFAQSCFARGEAKCTYGTGAFILATLGDAASVSTSGLSSCVAWRLDGHSTYCVDGQIYTAGAAVGWLQRLGLLDGVAALDALPAGEPEDVMFAAALAGLGAPQWAPEAQGAWVGLSLDTSREELIRAALWGIAAQIAILGKAVEADMGTPLTRLRVDGGLARSAVLMQAQADLLQVPVERYPSADATALGVGALARLGAGAARDPQEAVGDWRPSALFEPQMSADEAAARVGRHAELADWIAQRGTNRAPAA